MLDVEVEDLVVRVGVTVERLELDTVAALLLGPVHRVVGVLEQCREVGVWVVGGDHADARVQLDGQAVDLVGTRQVEGDALRNGTRLLG
jgi:hypothetical protein